MGNLKTGLWIVICGFVALLFFQNQEVFLANRTLRMDLFFAKYQTPQLPDILLFAGTFAIGYLISYFANLSSRFKSKKMMKQLKATLDAQQKELISLKGELDTLKAAPPKDDIVISPDQPEQPKTEETAMPLEEPSEGPEDEDASAQKEGETEKPVG